MTNDIGQLEKQVQAAKLVTDHTGRIKDISPAMSYHFSLKEEEVLNCSVHAVIKEAGTRRKDGVFYGVIAGVPCLYQSEKTVGGRTYQVLLRENDVHKKELQFMLQAMDRTKGKGKRDNRYGFGEILGNSASICQVKDLAAKIAISNSTVLLTGESGTGKELFAQAIHDLSSRKNHPFVAVNCVAIPDDLFESEIFGYEAGAFSGAKKEGKPGKIELAQHGTLFLDEISELTYQSQGKLLRVLQEREVERLGGTASKNVDIRVIAATNRDLKSLVKEGKFRQDLFYRLYVFDLQIPALRQRKDDILLLAQAFIEEYNRKMGKEIERMDLELEEWLVHYDWPGNVRELKSYIERGMNIAEGKTLKMDHLAFPSFSGQIPKEEEQPTALESLEAEVRNAEIHAIQKALKEADGDRSLAAHLLRIHVASLYRKISKYNLK
ncbi:sigma-54 interaction domain-containing protein [Virgibacillus xinjiangensis]|uniref:Sigma-54 interaction domain-containing protein n=1 Tax=Virgibacillus xinjiangensis TaxID=393090 RepID=A0ABV7CZL5_9BACI